MTQMSFKSLIHQDHLWLRWILICTWLRRQLRIRCTRKYWSSTAFFSGIIEVSTTKTALRIHRFFRSSSAMRTSNAGTNLKSSPYSKKTSWNVLDSAALMVKLFQVTARRHVKLKLSLEKSLLKRTSFWLSSRICKMLFIEKSTSKLNLKELTTLQAHSWEMKSSWIIRSIRKYWN